MLAVLLLWASLGIRTDGREIVSRVAIHGLMASRVLIFGSFRIVRRLGCDFLHAARIFECLLLNLLVQALLLQLWLDQRAVIEVVIAVQIDAEQVEVRANRRLRRIR